MDRSNLCLTELIDVILEQMKTSGFAETTRGFYAVLFHRLCRMANERGEDHYTSELGSAFINDDSHIIPENTKRYHHERTGAYTRCIKFIETFLATGQADWSPALRSACFPITSDILRERFSCFVDKLVDKDSSPTLSMDTGGLPITLLNSLKARSIQIFLISGTAMFWLS